ncbi:MAG: 30S ribosomal protein S21 [bacterium]
MPKVYLRDSHPNASYQDREYAFKKMVSAFHKAVADAGIIHECKKREFYESPGEKRRRKKKESHQNILKEKMRENFPRRRVIEEQ